jgi:hypothetical protein
VVLGAGCAGFCPGVFGRGNGCGVCANDVEMTVTLSAATLSTATNEPRKHGITELL